MCVLGAQFLGRRVAQAIDMPSCPRSKRAEDQERDTKTPSSTPDRRVPPPLFTLTSEVPIVPAPGMPAMTAGGEVGGALTDQFAVGVVPAGA